MGCNPVLTGSACSTGSTRDKAHAVPVLLQSRLNRERLLNVMVLGFGGTAPCELQSRLNRERLLNILEEIRLYIS